MESDNFKAHGRKGIASHAIGRFEIALKELAWCLEIQPTDRRFQQLFDECQKVSFLNYELWIFLKREIDEGKFSFFFSFIFPFIGIGLEKLCEHDADYFLVQWKRDGTLRKRCSALSLYSSCELQNARFIADIFSREYSSNLCRNNLKISRMHIYNLWRRSELCPPHTGWVKGEIFCCGPLRNLFSFFSNGAIAVS